MPLRAGDGCLLNNAGISEEGSRPEDPKGGILQHRLGANPDPERRNRFWAAGARVRLRMRPPWRVVVARRVFWHHLSPRVDPSVPTAEDLMNGARQPERCICAKRRVRTTAVCGNRPS
jgi:hypothetical protein